MSNKIPCGGFKLDNNFLGMNENDELSLTGGSEGESKAYKQLVTDGTGTAKWEDRLAYECSRLVVDIGADTTLVKVADEVPSLVIADKPATIYFDQGNFDGVVLQLSNTLLGVLGSGDPLVLIALTDNCEFDGGVLLEKGVYFYSDPESHVNRCVIDGALEFTWDGSLYAPKQIDEKFIPKTNPLILYVFVDGLVLKNNNKSEPVHATVEEIRQAFLGAGVYTTPATDDVGELGSLSQVIYFGPASAKIATKDSIYSINAPS